MSYEICYAKNFIRTTRGIIPLALMGSSNCTEYIGGREVLERGWTILGTGNDIELPEKEIINRAKPVTDTLKDHELFMFNSRWVCHCPTKEGGGIDYLVWMKNGCRDACTLEEYKDSRATLKLHCGIYRATGNYTNSGMVPEMDEYVSSTEALEKWIDGAKAFISGCADRCYPVMEFPGRNGIKKPQPDMKGQVIVKKGRAYISSFIKNGANLTYNIHEAQIFEDAQTAKDALHEHFMHGYTLVSAERIKVCSDRDYIITLDGRIFERLTARSIRFTHSNPKRFKTEKQALDYIEKTLKPKSAGLGKFEVEYNPEVIGI